MINKRLFTLLLIAILLTVSACGSQQQAGPSDAGSPDNPLATSITYPDTWYDFSGAQPVLDDAGDADLYDVKKVYAANDDDYLYIGFEVTDAGHLDCTTMMRGGDNCLFAVVDMPGFFRVAEDDAVYADSSGVAAYNGIAAYQYADGLLTIRMPLVIFEDTISSLSINATFRDNLDGEKTDVDTIDEFQYTLT